MKEGLNYCSFAQGPSKKWKMYRIDIIALNES